MKKVWSRRAPVWFGEPVGGSPVDSRGRSDAAVREGMRPTSFALLGLGLFVGLRFISGF